MTSSHCVSSSSSYLTMYSAWMIATRKLIMLTRVSYTAQIDARYTGVGIVLPFGIAPFFYMMY